MTAKKIIGKVHLWLGFSSGLLVFIIAITGCIYAFQAEIQNLTQSYKFVEPRQHSFALPSTMQAVGEAALPGKHIHGILYGGKDEAVEIIFYSEDPAYYYVVYANPYTAEVLKVKNMDADFFAIVLDGHFYLWLPPNIGQPLVASATLVFVVMLISGIVLWWPKQRKDAKQRFTIKWDARWRRKNYDLHNVLGFYAWSIALVLAFTGLVWGFQWFADGAYVATGGTKSRLYTEPVSDTTFVSSDSVPAIDRVFALMQNDHPNAETIEVHVPVTKESPIAANANPDRDTYWQLDYRYFDQHTLKEQAVTHVWGRFQDADGADKLLRMNYDIHTGAVLGLPGKILAFFASLICASLPVTGVYIWWGRRNKKQHVVGRVKYQHA